MNHPVKTVTTIPQSPPALLPSLACWSLNSGAVWPQGPVTFNPFEILEPLRVALTHTHKQVQPVPDPRQEQDGRRQTAGPASGSDASNAALRAMGLRCGDAAHEGGPGSALRSVLTHVQNAPGPKARYPLKTAVPENAVPSTPSLHPCPSSPSAP